MTSDNSRNGDLYSIHIDGIIIHGEIMYKEPAGSYCLWLFIIFVTFKFLKFSCNNFILFY